jgi:hypothetical protein
VPITANRWRVVLGCGLRVAETDTCELLVVGFGSREERRTNNAGVVEILVGNECRETRTTYSCLNNLLVKIRKHGSCR